MALPNLSGEFGITKEPELRFQPDGTAILGLRLAADDSKYDRQTQQRTQANKRVFVDVTLWRGDAEAVAEMGLKPGQKITINGPVYMREYDKNDGTKGQALTVDAYAFGIRPRPVSQGGNQQGGQQAPQQANPWNNQPPQQNQQAPQQGGGYQQAPAQGYPQQNQQNQQMPPQQNQQGGGWPQGGSDTPPF